MSSSEGGHQGNTQTAQQVVTTSVGQIMSATQQGSPSQHQQQHQQQQQQQAQIQLQQAGQQHQGVQGQNAVQQVQLLPQMQNQAFYQQLFGLQSNPGNQLLMPGNIFNQGLNPQIQPAQITQPTIQVISKPFQPGQLTHMLNGGYAIPTSGSNNAVNHQYIIGNFPASPLQLQQQSKPGEMPKVQIGNQLPQGLWPTTQTFLTSTNGQNYLIRGTHPDQVQFIQQQLSNNGQTQQSFPMPIQTAQPQQQTSITTTTSVQQNVQQGNLQQNLQQQQQQQNQNQPQAIQPQPNVVSIKGPANLQPKPPLQIQPSPQNPHQITQAQQQQIHQQIQVAMSQSAQQQIQMIPQQTVTSQQQSIIPQSISITQSPSGITTAHLLQQQQQFQNQSQPRQLTILPQGTTAQQITSQPVQIIQQQQPNNTNNQQSIRPQFTGVNVTMTTQQNQPTTGNNNSMPVAGQQRPKIRKSSVRAANPTLHPPRPGAQALNSVQSPQPKQVQMSHQNQIPISPRVPVSVGHGQPQGQGGQQQQQNGQPLKTINMAALQPNLPDATLTPLNPQQTTANPNVGIQQPQQIQLFPATQLPNPSISITPTNMSSPHRPNTPKKEAEHKEVKSEGKNETEKENSTTNSKTPNTNGTEETDDQSTNKQKLPKAMVKPQVLTHVVEGFVIQEAAEPFPMSKGSECHDEPASKKKKMAVANGEMGKCEMCGKVDLKVKFKKNQRFCSSKCAKGMKAQQQQQQQHQQQNQQQVNQTFNNPNAIVGDDKSKMQKVGNKGQKWGEGDGMDTDETSSSMGEASTLSPTDERHIETLDDPKMNPLKWGVVDVVNFVKSIPGCSEYADDFELQEIDGQALLLIKADNLMLIGMKLGPALKLCAKIEQLRQSVAMGASNDSSTTKA